MLRKVPIYSLLVGLFAVVMLASPGSVAAGTNPTDECDDFGLIPLDKIDGISGSDDYTSDQGIIYTVTVTDNPNPTPDTYTVSPDPSGQYPGFINITQVPKFGEGGGLSHITICGDETDDPTATVPPPTATVPDPTATVPEPTATVPEPTATLPPGVTPTVTNTPPPGATNTPTSAPNPTATTQVVSVLPVTGAEPGATDGTGKLLLAAISTVLLIAGASIAVRTQRSR
jgi:hypothetical protein